MNTSIIVGGLLRRIGVCVVCAYVYVIDYKGNNINATDDVADTSYNHKWRWRRRWMSLIADDTRF